jgi:hypothetical protein
MGSAKALTQMKGKVGEDGIGAPSPKAQDSFVPCLKPETSKQLDSPESHLSQIIQGGMICSCLEFDISLMLSPPGVTHL